VIRVVIDTNVVVSSLLSPTGNEALILLAIH
jgi:predicted nucleic acid-binding protein